MATSLYDKPSWLLIVLFLFFTNLASEMKSSWASGAPQGCYFNCLTAYEYFATMRQIRTKEIESVFGDSDLDFRYQTGTDSLKLYKEDNFYFLLRLSEKGDVLGMAVSLNGNPDHVKLPFLFDQNLKNYSDTAIESVIKNFNSSWQVSKYTSSGGKEVTIAFFHANFGHGSRWTWFSLAYVFPMKKLKCLRSSLPHRSMHNTIELCRLNPKQLAEFFIVDPDIRESKYTPIYFECITFRYCSEKSE